MGIVAVIAESYERIHRSNLVGMGILPLQYLEGVTAASLGLTGKEIFSVHDLNEGHATEVLIKATDPDGVTQEFTAKVRLDTPQEVLYYQHGGILPYVLRQLV